MTPSAQESGAAERVLVLMPTPRDAERTVALLTEAGIPSMACADLTELCRGLRAGAGAVLLTDETLSGEGGGQLSEALSEQPAWSALPILVLAREGWSSQSQRLGSYAERSLIVVERPVRTLTLVGVVSSALRGRQHQYEIRDALLLREQQAALLARQADELRRADRRKDEFLATLAHELRNPLAPIRTGMDLLARAPESEPMQRTIGVMQRQIAHMVRLIDDLLDVSRITSGKLQLKRERIELGAIIDAAVEASRPLIERKNQTLDVAVSDGALPLDADLTRIAQVIGNLLNNASNYTPNGGRIELSTSREGDLVLIRVSDNGAGIPAERLNDVFEMFSQVNRTLERSHGGLGIGLALVRSLVEMHGGTAEAASPGLGKGSTFSVKLPLAASASRSVAAHAKVANSKPETSQRILVVDDNEDAAEMLALVLGQSGYRTRTAYDSRSALSAVDEWTPHVVILDIGLPDINGYDVARELRRRERCQGLSLIALTGWGTRDDKQKAMEAGFDLHLTKPVDAMDLRAALAQLEHRPRAHGAGAAPPA
jgi:signal transduction histidine kinase/ActR/RegA family two-component response regulator